jgi:hypothetical protein
MLATELCRGPPKDWNTDFSTTGSAGLKRRNNGRNDVETSIDDHGYDDPTIVLSGEGWVLWKCVEVRQRILK